MAYLYLYLSDLRGPTLYSMLGGGVTTHSRGFRTPIICTYWCLVFNGTPYASSSPLAIIRTLRLLWYSCYHQIPNPHELNPLHLPPLLCHLRSQPPIHFQEKV